MAVFSTSVIIPYYTAIPEDVVVNVWHHEFDDVTPPVAGDFEALESSIAAFYEECFDSPFGMAPWMRPLLTRMKTFNLSDPQPRVPVRDVVVPMTGVVVEAAGSVLPEVAACLSIQGVRESGEPQARRRGRLFLGGLGNTCITAGAASAFPLLSNNFRIEIAAAADAHVEVAVTTGWDWGVWSRTDSAFIPVTNGWIDNAADTQRRRGQAASARTLWAATLP